MMTLSSYLVISTFLFCCGVMVVIGRKNVIAIMLGIELIMNAAGLNFVAYTRFANDNLDGHVMSLFIIIIAAAEAAVGLAIAIRFFQIKDSIHIDDATQLQG